MARKSDVRKAQAEAKKAEADAAARRAEAEARAIEAKAKAEAARAETERQAEQARLQREKEKASEAAAQRRADAKRDVEWIATGAQVFAMGVGMYAGHKLAHGVDARHAASIKAKSGELTRLGNQISNIKPGPKSVVALKQTAVAADKMRLTKVKGPLGLGLAAALVAEAAVARLVVAPGQEDSPMAQAITNAVATGSTMAAIGLVGTQAINRATPAAVPDAVAMAQVEAARKGEVLPIAKEAPAKPDGNSGRTIAKKPIGPPVPGSHAALKLEAKQLGITPGKMSKASLTQAISKAGGRLIAPAIIAVAAGSAFADAASAGESTAGAAAAAARAGATTGADIVTGGGVSVFREARENGVDTAGAALAAVMRGAGAIATLGAGEIAAGLVSSLPTKSYTPESVRRKQARGGAFLNAGAERKASKPSGARAPTLARMQSGAGWRNGRGFANKKVQAAAQAARRRAGK